MQKKQRTDMSPWEYQAEEPERRTREIVKGVGRENSGPYWEAGHRHGLIIIQYDTLYHFHIFYCLPPPLEYDTFLYLQNLE